MEPHDHILNATKRDIQVFKYQFISDVYATDSKFIIVFWDKILVQYQHTLNILQKSLTNPQLSVYEKLDGDFYFNKTILTTKAQEQSRTPPPATRNIWKLHGGYLCYIGPKKEHY